MQVVPLHNHRAMKMNGLVEVYTTLDIINRWMYGRLHGLAALPLGKRVQYQLNGKLGVLQNQDGCC
jgi:hypothetical protein